MILGESQENIKECFVLWLLCKSCCAEFATHDFALTDLGCLLSKSAVSVKIWKIGVQFYEKKKGINAW